MESLPEIAENVRLPVHIAVSHFLFDHCVEGKGVLPAVEAMQVLAASVRTLRPDACVERMADAAFAKFLPVLPGTDGIAALSDISFHNNGDITARLLTRTRSGKASITRVKEHARIRFSCNGIPIRALPVDVAAALEGIVFEVPAERIYRDLVPFGPAYRNITDALHISADGALAKIHAPAEPVRDDLPRPLGSPFPLDAAFHAACVWGQRFAGFVAFPTGFQKRVIFKPLCAGEDYIGRIVPVRKEPGLLVFDVWIYDSTGFLFEAVYGIAMRDVTAGRIRPPSWILPDEAAGQEKVIGNGHYRLSVIELETVMPFAEAALSENELQRLERMGSRRRQSYLAARLACKRLARKLSKNDMETPAAAIRTVRPDMVRPCCPLTDGTDPFSCAASHDNRFAVAVASRQRVGIDVERASERILRCQRLFMDEGERALVESSPLGRIASSLRVWSIKEAACKALNITLPDAWERVRVTGIGRDESQIRIDGSDAHAAFHDAVDEHLITIVKIE
jgi:phosphopantetheinyl transferase